MRGIVTDMYGPAVRETHISTLFFSGDRVFKLLKPVRNGFLDHVEADRRIDAAERELHLNRRMAPDVYLGTADVIEHGDLVDRMIVMRRLPAERALSALIERGELTPDLVRQIARTIAVFHSSLEPIRDPAGPGSLFAHRSNWESSFAELDQFVGRVLDADADAEIRQLARSYMDGHVHLFEDRVSRGYIRDGHGDLLADDIFCLDDGPRVLDCLAFRDDLRIGDVLSDLAFLAMDLHRLAGPSAAADLMRDYTEFTAETHPGSLAHHYVAYRAHVRCKVACLRWQQGLPEMAAVARMYHRMTLDQLEYAQPRVILVGGGPGTGKTTIANELGDRFGWAVLSSDVVRKDLSGVEHGAHAIAKPDEGIYEPSVTEATYSELVRLGREIVLSGDSVVLDASWTKAEHRDAAATLATECGARLVEIECVVNPVVARERVARRMAEGWNPSDATPEIVDHLRTIRDEWATAATLDTAHPVGDCVSLAVELARRSHEPLPEAPPVLFWHGIVTQAGAAGFEHFEPARPPDRRPARRSRP